MDWIAQRVGIDSDTVVTLGAAHDARAAPFLPLLAAAAVLGEPVDAPILASMLAIDRRQAVAMLTTLAARGQLRCVTEEGVAVYTFTDPALLAAAKGAIAPGRRRDLHAAAADAIAKEMPTAATALAAVRIAGHREAAQQWLEAARTWRAAAVGVAGEGNVVEAGRQLERAAAIARSHRDQVPASEEIAALALLGPMQAQISGSGSPAVGAIYARCLEICAELDVDEAIGKFDALWGVCACILVHGRVSTARELSRRLLQLADVAENRTYRLLARRLDGLGQLLAGDIADAIASFSAVEQLHDPASHDTLYATYASDQLALALAHRSWAETLAGDAMAAHEHERAAIRRLMRLRHPHTSAHVLSVLAARAQTLGQRGRAAPLAIAAREIGRRHGFHYWIAWSGLILAWHGAERNPQAAISTLDAAINAYAGTGAAQALPYAYLLKAGIALAVGDSQTAAEAAGSGLELAEAYGVRLFDAELLRCKAIAVGHDGNRNGLLRGAAALAKHQGAGLFAARADAALSGRAY